MDQENKKGSEPINNEVDVLQTFSETSTDRYWYRIVEKKWQKGNFFSLERGDLIKLMDGSGKGQGYPTKMFTLPKDPKVLNTLIEGLQKILANGGLKVRNR